MKRKTLLVSLILFSILYSVSSYAENPIERSNPVVQSMKIKYRDTVVYPNFIVSIKNGVNYLDDYGSIYLKEEHRNLVIGCSPVAFMSFYGQMHADELSYDLIGFGGAQDIQVFEMLQNLKKKYTKIVIWGAVNDIFEYIQDNKDIDSAYYNVLNAIFDEARLHLKGTPADKIVFVNVKKMIPEIDDSTVEYCDKYNRIAEKINSYVKRKKIAAVDITVSTDDNYSEWYLHYHNPEAIKKVLVEIDSN